MLRERIASRRHKPGLNMPLCGHVEEVSAQQRRLDFAPIMSGAGIEKIKKFEKFTKFLAAQSVL